VKEFCAVGFWFAERVQQDLKVPIGLIWASHGSSSAETWIPREALMGDPDFSEMFEREKAANYPVLMAEYTVALSNWQVKADAARQLNQPPPAKPTSVKEKYAYIIRHAPGNTFNGGISPLIPFGLRGVLWYQGEHNAPRGYQYRKVLPILIHQWRTLWGQGDFPFLIVQLPGYGSNPAEPRDSEWAELREAQAMTARTVTNCGYAVTIDIGESRNIHPINKWDVGKRLALLALGTVYGRDLPYSGPVFDKMTAEGDVLRLQFQHTAGGLVAGTNGVAQPLRGFAVAGADRHYVWANARIDGDSVIVTATNVAAPVAVRYAWANSPVCNLYNRAGLPAAPFRTDDWPGCTVTNR
jgi:sialate O-acetylesterase